MKAFVGFFLFILVWIPILVVSSIVYHLSAILFSIAGVVILGISLFVLVVYLAAK